MIADSPAGLLASDLDGTLAVSGRIGEADLAAARRLRSACIPILIVTGRNRLSLERVSGLWDVADEVLFSSGAGHLEGPDSPGTERARLGEGELPRILNILDAAGEDYCVLDAVPNNHGFAWKINRRPEENPDFEARMKIYRSWARPLERLDDGASQVLVIRPAGVPLSREMIDALSEWSVFRSHSPLDNRSTWLEIFPSGLDKGSAVARLCAEKSVPRNRVLALGNDYNDEAMLAWAEYGRVVAGAPDALKAAYTVLPPAGAGGFAAAAREALELFGESAS